MESILYFVKKMHAYSGKVLYMNFLGMMMISLLEGIGIVFLIPMITMSGIASLNLDGTPLTNIIEWLQQAPDTLGLLLILIIYVMISICQNVLQRQITIRNSIIQHSFFRHLRIETYSALLYANWGFYLKKRKSDLIHLLTSEIATASAGTHSFLQFMASIIFTVIQIGLAFWLSPQITLFVLISGTLLVLLSRKYLQKSQALGHRNFESGQQYLAGITDQINGIKDIKSNSLEDSRIQWFSDVTLKMQNEQLEYTRLSTKSQLLYKGISALLVAILVYTAAKLFNAQASQLLLIIVIFSRLWPRVAGIQASMEQIAMRIPSYKAVIAVQNECIAAREFNLVGTQEIGPQLHLEQGIACQHVYFRYNGDTADYALRDINVFFPANQMTAVIGRSGAGKSTLIDLLMGLNKPEQGQVLIDGKPLSSDDIMAYRQVISYVPQEPYLFNATIRENLLLVESEADEAKIWEALEFAAAAEFVRKLPDRLDTYIGDRGIRLSGGERQRLVLARAILRNPAILILDEATSALDVENETKIQEALERLKGSLTIIVIAHRLTTIRNADQVIVMDQGSIIRKENASKEEVVPIV